MSEEKEQGLNGNLRCPIYENGELSCRGAKCGMYFAEDCCCSMVAMTKYLKTISETQFTINKRLSSLRHR